MNKVFEKILKKIEEKRNKYQRLADGSNFDGWKEILMDGKKRI